ncbi:ABC-type branched-chain amino acid transport systems, ATPase component [Desulfosporosinus acidiphilus SJ4]|uniref:ABC-type branched-chain amino acid transport systems, ATPase component n=1 Tax=Desulfosporosinus acidiphilus (strain DSM 22704 / JCM 16185 / SJ4) TaxID=646529 RepID=I4D770_DESAJ|nr:ATP-binding cassette domain-containing protein [Desulfosporosinus acidiphilus]AFM41644.1 ABC-type branched-chain amino acid transport systems, ATPase component [Desulfosporosinus acidiphilus SJ4]
MLKVNAINVSYGKVEIIKQVSFEVNQGEVVVIIGANGAGKTTIMKTVTGLLKPTQGEIMFEGQTISRTPAEKIVKLGLAMCPEGRQVFPQHTVYENLVLGGYLIRKDKQMFLKNIEQMYSLFPILKERSKQFAGTLSGGEQQMLAIARAMMSNPKLLLLDEPSAGLAPIYVKGIFDMIRKLSEQGTTILLVEQMANMALKIANRAYVLETGRIALGGTAEEIMNDPKVVESYLGAKKY